MTSPEDPLWALRVRAGPGGGVDVRRVAHFHELADDGGEVAVLASDAELERLVGILRRGLA